MKNLLWSIYILLIFTPIIVVATALTATITLIGSALGFGRTWGYYPEIIWSRLFCWLAFVRVSVSGRENIDPHTSYVFVANHQSAYDIFTVYGYLGHNFRWMMKESLRKIPLVGWACARSGQIFVSNKSVNATRHTMAKAEQQLRAGMSLVVFPEGARTPDGHMHRFKKGAFMLAVEFNLPVVPLSIDGAYNVMTRYSLMPRPGHIHLTIHKPIHPAPGQSHDLSQLMAQSAADIASALPDEQKPLRNC